MMTPARKLISANELLRYAQQWFLGREFEETIINRVQDGANGGKIGVFTEMVEDISSNDSQPNARNITSQAMLVKVEWKLIVSAKMESLLFDI